MEVTNRFKRLQLVDRVLEELWAEIHTIVQEAVTEAIHKKARWLSEEALQIVEERKEMKNKGKEKDMPN